MLGVPEQIIGDPAFGAHRVQYAGILGPLTLNEEQRYGLMALGVALAQQCDLRGLFGVDAILDPRGRGRGRGRGRIWPVEINPRYTASVEIIERATGIAALSHEPLHPPEPAPTRPAPDAEAPPPCCGKAVIFARRDAVAPDLYQWYAPGQIADVPHPGEPIQAGQPVCTLLAAGDNRQACLDQLHEHARALYTRIEP
jgi:predicted ATP-grasp superfamily ATP-dependent carboligase